MAIILPRIQPGTDYGYQGYQQKMQQEIQDASRMKLAELMSNLKVRQQAQQREQSMPFFQQKFGPELGAKLASTDPRIQAQELKNLQQQENAKYLAPIFEKILGSNSLYQPDINETMSALAQEGGQPGQAAQPGSMQIDPNKIAGITSDQLMRIIPALQEKQKIDLKTQQFNQAEENKIQAELQPWIEEQSNKAQHLNNENMLLRQIRGILFKAKNAYPDLAVRNLPEALNKLAIQDPSIREVDALLNQYVAEKERAMSSGTGKSSKFYTQLIKSGKPDLTMPFETVINLIDSDLKRNKIGLDTFNFIEKSFNKKTNRYPRDIKTRAIKNELARTNPMDFPEDYDVGDINQTLHKILVEENGEKKWKDL